MQQLTSNAKNAITKNKLYIDKLNYFLLNDMSDTDVDKLQKIMTDKILINSLNDLIHHLYTDLTFPTDVIKISSKKFILAWLIVAFPSYILEIKQVNADDENYFKTIYLTSVKLLASFNEIVTNCNEDVNEINTQQFISNYVTYAEKIVEFIRKDKLHHILSLTNEYMSITTIINEIEISKKYDDAERIRCIIELHKSKMRIIAHLKKIDSSIDIEQLINDSS